jgi:hypothetical protein
MFCNCYIYQAIAEKSTFRNTHCCIANHNYHHTTECQFLFPFLSLNVTDYKTEVTDHAEPYIMSYSYSLLLMIHFLKVSGMLFKWVFITNIKSTSKTCLMVATHFAMYHYF